MDWIKRSNISFNRHSHPSSSGWHSREAKLQEQRALQQQQMQEKFRKLRENRLKQMEAHGSDSRAAAFKKPSSKESDSSQKN